MAQIDAWSDVRAAVRQRDIRALIKLMFRRGTVEFNFGFRTENELWDYKKDCPRMGKEHFAAWADLAKEVLGMHNNGGGALIFGISDNYTFIGARNRLDGKQLNDGLRRFLPDRIWVDFNREFIREDQSFLGVALVPPRGPSLERFTVDAPTVNGRRAFLVGWSAIRRKDSTFILNPAEADHLDNSSREPLIGRPYAVDEPLYRILQPDYRTFVMRQGPADAIQAALTDKRVATVSIVGIGGIGPCYARIRPRRTTLSFQLPQRIASSLLAASVRCDLNLRASRHCSTTPSTSLDLLTLKALRRHRRKRKFVRSCVTQAGCCS
jgi:hypothetical protein